MCVCVRERVSGWGRGECQTRGRKRASAEVVENIASSIHKCANAYPPSMCVCWCMSASAPMFFVCACIAGVSVCVLERACLPAE